MATYTEIQSDIKDRFGKSIKTCWIADVKELNGLKPKPSVNRLSLKIRKHPCPDNYRKMIEDSMRKFRMIK